MVVLVDTNVLLDVISMREPYDENSIRVIEHCALRTVQGYIAVHSIFQYIFYFKESIYGCGKEKNNIKLYEVPDSCWHRT